MTGKTTTNATRVLDARKAVYAIRTFAAADFTALLLGEAPTTFS